MRPNRGTMLGIKIVLRQFLPAGVSRKPARRPVLLDSRVRGNDGYCTRIRDRICEMEYQGILPPLEAHVFQEEKGIHFLSPLIPDKSGKGLSEFVKSWSVEPQPADNLGPNLETPSHYCQCVW